MKCSITSGSTPARDVRFLVSGIAQAELPEAYFDGIFVSNFLEHLRDAAEIAAFLGKMWECAEYFDCCDHHVILTERSAQEHLYAAGFEIQCVCPRFLPYSFGGRLPTHPALVRAYLRLRPAWSLLGKRFFVIAARPGYPGAIE